MFQAIKGWFNKFKKRRDVHSVVRCGEAASSNSVAADNFLAEFQEYVEAEEFVPQQVFSCDETGLFWKKMPKRTCIGQKKKPLPRHEAMKDRLMLVVSANVSGDFKSKPLIYHSENP